MVSLPQCLFPACKERLALFILLLAALTSGCAPSRQYGDARLTYVPASFFQRNRSEYRLTLPEVSLARKGTTEFHVSSLPAAKYIYYLRLKGGSLYKGPYTPETASHYKARVEFRFVAPDGSILAKVTEPLAEMSWGRDGASIAANAFPQLPSPLHDARSYRLQIVVRQPSLAPRERLQVYGFLD